MDKFIKASVKNPGTSLQTIHPRLAKTYLSTHIRSDILKNISDDMMKKIIVKLLSNKAKLDAKLNLLNKEVEEWMLQIL